MVLVCVDKKSDSYPLFGASKTFAINILSNHQETLSRRFAKSGGDKFTGIGFRIGVSGSPILSDTIAFLDCKVRHEFDAGDHTIYIGEALDIAVSSDSDPLLYFRGGYRNLSA
jgi:flavin reductase (DIM6/NTAB) family NADH-FMN oxidoreductase RutF